MARLTFALVSLASVQLNGSALGSIENRWVVERVLGGSPGAYTHWQLQRETEMALIRTWAQMRRMEDDSRVAAIAAAGSTVGVGGGFFTAASRPVAFRLLGLALGLDPRGGN